MVRSIAPRDRRQSLQTTPRDPIRLGHSALPPMGQRAGCRRIRPTRGKRGDQRPFGSGAGIGQSIAQRTVPIGRGHPSRLVRIAERLLD